MKRKFFLAVLIFQAAVFGAFAANPASDFRFVLNTDKDGTEWVAIGGLRNEKINELEIPAEIKGVPVRDVTIVNFLSRNPVTLPDGIKNCYFRDCTFTLSQLPNSIEYFTVSGASSHVKLMGSLNNLTNLKKVVLSGVELADKKFVFRFKESKIGDRVCKIQFPDYNFNDTNIEELVFGEGIEFICLAESFGCKNSNLKKIVFPSTLKEFIVPRYYEYLCRQRDVSKIEFVIPENIEHIEIINTDGKLLELSWREILVDNDRELSLKTQAQLIGVFESKQAQKKFEFENIFD